MNDSGAAFIGINSVPGPGAYAPEKSMKGYEAKRGYSMAQKYEFKPALNAPGPGTYERKTFVDQKRPSTAK